MPVTLSAMVTRRRLFQGLPVFGGLCLARAEDWPDLDSIAPDLTTPAVQDGEPGAGLRVKQVNPEYAGTDVYHALYLPTDWKPGGLYPVIVEYAGNGPYRSQYGDFSSGKLEGSTLGYGISGGRGFIWISMPYVNAAGDGNQLNWWGDVEATVAYCRNTVKRICEEFGGDTSSVILTGFSRGAIACNYIGLHDDAIADIWLAFIPYSHYDGVKKWDYAGSDRVSALRRLERLKGRASFICHERSVEATRSYLDSTGVRAPFQFEVIPFRNHNDAWTLRDIPARRTVRQWLRDVLDRRPGTHEVSGWVRGADGKPASGVRIQSGETHWTHTDGRGRFALRGLIDSRRMVVPGKAGYRFTPPGLEVLVAGKDCTNIGFKVERSL